MPRSRGRTGRPFRRARANVLARSRICWLCGGDRCPHCGVMGSGTVDHVTTVAELPPDSPLLADESNLRPAHGCCNRFRGAGPAVATHPMATSRDWLNPDQAMADAAALGVGHVVLTPQTNPGGDSPSPHPSGRPESPARSLPT